jgi:hypothetical protein
MQDPDRSFPSRRTRNRQQQANRRLREKAIDEQEYEDEAYEEEEQPELAPLPDNGRPSAILTGVLAGAFIAALNIVLTYLNASTYNAAARASTSTASSYAGIIIGLWCLNIVISLLLCFAVGFFLGKTKIARNLGFYGGATAGVVMYIGSFLVNYIPNYPGHLASGSPITINNITGGLLTSLVILIIQGFIGGLFGLWGAWAATRHSPYYQQA